MKLLVALIAAAALLGCGDDEPDPSGIAWNTYADDLLADINQAGRRGDCERLGRMLDAYGQSDDAHRARHGKGNADLMAYIDDVARGAGCYD